MLAGQMAVTHALAMDMLSRTKRAGFIDEMHAYGALATKLLRTYTMQTEALAKVKRGGETTKQTWFEADINRTAGEIALVSPERDAVKAQAFFERALEIARGQQARSWELRAAMSLARLWRDQGKPAEAHDLLAPVYRGFAEGFDTIDLKEAKALLDELAQ
ncbi:MAG TPA: hypothetical protein VFE60_09950 [Roseiarcus sp.]|nr:hypothetical protein [Roseiarcus sp.]